MFCFIPSFMLKTYQFGKKIEIEIKQQKKILLDKRGHHSVYFSSFDIQLCVCMWWSLKMVPLVRFEWTRTELVEEPWHWCVLNPIWWMKAHQSTDKWPYNWLYLQFIVRMSNTKEIYCAKHEKRVNSFDSTIAIHLIQFEGKSITLSTCNKFVWHHFHQIFRLESICHQILFINIFQHSFWIQMN